MKSSKLVHVATALLLAACSSKSPTAPAPEDPPARCADIPHCPGGISIKADTTKRLP